MRRFVFPIALWAYVCIDRGLQGVGAALYFGHGWDMSLIWLVALIFVAMVGRMVWQEPHQRTLLLAPPAQPSSKEFAWTLFLLSLFTCFLIMGTVNIQQWWHAAWVDMWFKVVLGLVQLIFWCVAGRWWRDTIQTLAQMMQNHASQRKQNR